MLTAALLASMLCIGSTCLQDIKVSEIEWVPTPVVETRKCPRNYRIAYWSASAADMYTTHRALSSGAHEANPTFAMFDDHPNKTIAANLILTAGVDWAVCKMYKKDWISKRQTKFLYGLWGGLRFSAAVNNSRFINE